MKTSGKLLELMEATSLLIDRFKEREISRNDFFLEWGKLSLQFDIEFLNREEI